MSWKPARENNGRYTKEQIDFIAKAQGKYKEVAKAFNATFDRKIKEKTVKTLKQKHGAYRGNHKWTVDEMIFVLNAEGADSKVAADFQSVFGHEIQPGSVKQIKLRYGPGLPLPDTDKGKWSREQIQFVLDACDEPQYANLSDRAKYDRIAERFNARFDPTPNIPARCIRTIRERYGPGFPLPSLYTDEQFQFITQSTGTYVEIAAKYNAHFNPKVKVGTRAVKHIMEQHSSTPIQDNSGHTAAHDVYGNPAQANAFRPILPSVQHNSYNLGQNDPALFAKYDQTRIPQQFQPPSQPLDPQQPSSVVPISESVAVDPRLMTDCMYIIGAGTASTNEAAASGHHAFGYQYQEDQYQQEQYQYDQF